MASYEVTSVGIDSEWYYGIRKPNSVPVKVEHRVNECVAQPYMKRLIGVSNVKALV